MKGVILAGGAGTRLQPLTDTTNKHLLPVYDRPMIHYPALTLSELGVTELLLVTGQKWLQDFRQTLASLESKFENISFAAQTGTDGIVAALRQAEEFSQGQPLAVILGDNLLEKPPVKEARDFFNQPSGKQGAHIFLTETSTPEDFGIATLSAGEDKVIAIEEKPKKKPTAGASNLAIIGLYFYDHTVFKRAGDMEPSARGEYEITDLNRHYLDEGSLCASRLNGWWCDCGTFDSLLSASQLVANSRQPKKELIKV